MRKTVVALSVLALVTGCGEPKEPQHKATDDARDVAMVKRMNQAPFRPIKPEPFTADDLARYDVARGGCTFHPGNQLDEPPLFVAQADRGFLKVDGVLQPFSAKTGSAELPSGAHSTYMGLGNWVELVAQAGDEVKAPNGVTAWPSRLVIHDPEQRVAFNALGLVSCAGSEAKTTDRS